MNQGPRNTEEVLVLTCTPQDVVSVLEWRPFEHGNTLGEIITAHNLRCYGLLQEKTPKSFVDCLPEIKPTLTLGTCLGEDTTYIPPGRFDRVKIVLLDLDSGQDLQNRLRPIGEQLAGQDKLFHLVQVSRSPGAVSWAGYFADNRRVLKSDPEIFGKQSEFEKFLHVFREIYETSWAGVVQNPLDAPCRERMYNEPYIHPSRGHFMRPKSEEGKSVDRVYRNYRKKLPHLLASLRDVAMARVLTDEQVVNLGRSAAVQELLLTLISERVRPRLGHTVWVDPIRMPLSDIPAMDPLEMRELKKLNLVAVHLKESFQLLEEEPKKTLSELGFTDERWAVVYFDHPDLWKKTDPYARIVKRDRFQAELPGWSRRSSFWRASLNEISLGLKIKESLSKDMEVQ